MKTAWNAPWRELSSHYKTEGSVGRSHCVSYEGLMPFKKILVSRIPKAWCRAKFPLVAAVGLRPALLSVQREISLLTSVVG